MADTNQLEELRALLDNASRVAIFTGAGISTESGIPDFRSPGTGLWTKMKPIAFQDFVASEEVRQESWKRRFESERVIETAKPNRGHRAVQHLITSGKSTAVITQNIDNLHQNSGLREDQVIELHGNATYATCLSCSARFELEALQALYLETGKVSECHFCGGIVKSATISFGQAMPQVPMQQAQQETEAADLFLVLGSSLSVYPAAGFPEMAVQLGTPLIIINIQETPFDGFAELAIHHGIGDVLGEVLGIN